MRGERDLGRRPLQAPFISTFLRAEEGVMRSSPPLAKHLFIGLPRGSNLDFWIPLEKLSRWVKFESFS